MVTTLNMLLQMRRDDVFNAAYVLQPGEPGFEISTNTLKIGDGSKTWAELEIANKSAIDALIKVVDDKVAALDNTYATDAEVEEIRKTLAAATKQVADDLAAYELANDARVKLVEDDLKEGGATFTKISGIDTRVKAIEDAPYASEGFVTGKVDALANGAVAANTAAIEAINDEETGILAQAKSYVDTEDVFHTDILTVNALGGIGAGANLNNMTTHEILNTLLFPYVSFVLGSTSRSAAAATLENGETQTLSSASITVTKKSKPITSIQLINGTTVIEEKTGDAVANGGTITFNGFDAITVSKSNNPNLKFTVTDGQTTESKNVGASTFVYPYYWGVCAPDATIDEALVEGLTKSKSSRGNKTDIAFTCANQCQVFAYPKAHGVLKSIIDPNNFEIIDSFTRSELNITGLDGTTQAYYVYVSGACSVTDFKIDFKY